MNGSQLKHLEKLIHLVGFLPRGNTGGDVVQGGDVGVKLGIPR